MYASARPIKGTLSPCLVAGRAVVTIGSEATSEPSNRL
jgi:hypothetical protein